MKLNFNRVFFKLDTVHRRHFQMCLSDRTDIQGNTRFIVTTAGIQTTSIVCKCANTAVNEV